MNDVLTNITISLPTNTFENPGLFTELFDNAQLLGNTIQFDTTPAGSYPNVRLEFTHVTRPQTSFYSGANKLSEIVVENLTGKDWKSPYKYSHVTLPELRSRLQSHQIKFQYYDHLGIDIPWQIGVNPKLVELYRLLAPTSLLHSFPGNEDWKFVIPGSKEEISGEVKLDYQIERKPKFEFVNFKNCSTPLIQIDLAVGSKYEKTKSIFPEAIHDDKLRNMWVYLENSSGIDICLVLNEVGQGWTEFFRDLRVNSD